ncbi:hypothetical protein AMTRI_Chr03g143870 [Amborella trichopoda]
MYTFVVLFANWRSPLPTPSHPLFPVYKEVVCQSLFSSPPLTQRSSLTLTKQSERNFFFIHLPLLPHHIIFLRLQCGSAEIFLKLSSLSHFTPFSHQHSVPLNLYYTSTHCTSSEASLNCILSLHRPLFLPPPSSTSREASLTVFFT